MKAVSGKQPFRRVEQPLFGAAFSHFRVLKNSTWIRERLATVQMQGGNYVDYPLRYQEVDNTADVPLPDTPQGDGVIVSPCGAGHIFIVNLSSYKIQQRKAITVPGSIPALPDPARHHFLPSHPRAVDEPFPSPSNLAGRRLRAQIKQRI